MDTIDQPQQPTTNAPIWDTVIRFGLINGGIMLAFSLITYLADVDMMSISGMLIINLMLLAISFGTAAMAMRYQRDKLDGGFISYGKALGVGLLVVFIGMIISSCWNYVLLNFIDPDYLVGMKDKFVDQWGDKMPEEALNQALEGFDKAGEIGTILKNGLIGGGIFGLIVGLITAAFVKREPKPDYMR